MPDPESKNRFAQSLHELTILPKECIALVADHEKPMNIEKMIKELREERAGVEQAIPVLERIASGRSKRRGRPPKGMTQVKRRGRPPGSKNKPKDG